MMKRVKLGDVVEVKTSVGLAYAIYTHRHTEPPKYGALLRVLDKVFQERPTDVEDLSELPVRFSKFFPLQAAVNKQLVSIVGNIPVPAALQAFPTFRSALAPPPGRVGANVWWLWDGTKAWRVGDLTAEQRHLSIRGTCNDTFLRGLIEKNWRPENVY